MSNRDIRESLLALSQAITRKVKLSMVPRVNVVGSTMESRLRYFVRINSFIYLVSKVGEDPQEFLDDVNKVLSVVRVTYREKAELARTN